MENKTTGLQRAFEYWKDYFNKDFKFISPSQVPDIPVLPSEFMNEVVFPGLIKFGAVPKDKLEVGVWYEGRCRNSSTAKWNGAEFEYIRYKFGLEFIDTTPHFQDDDGSDFFIPIKVAGDTYQQYCNDRVKHLTK